jgi:hypothetical protein
VAAATESILSLDQDIPEGRQSQARAARGAAVPEAGLLPPGCLVAGEAVNATRRANDRYVPIAHGVGGDAPRLLTAQALHGHLPLRIILEINVSKRLPVRVADDHWLTAWVMLDAPGRREAGQPDSKA